MVHFSRFVSKQSRGRGHPQRASPPAVARPVALTPVFPKSNPIVLSFIPECCSNKFHLSSLHRFMLSKAFEINCLVLNINHFCEPFMMTVKGRRGWPPPPRLPFALDPKTLAPCPLPPLTAIVDAGHLVVRVHAATWTLRGWLRATGLLPGQGIISSRGRFEFCKQACGGFLFSSRLSASAIFFSKTQGLRRCVLNP